LHGECFAGARLTIGEDSSIEAVKYSLHQISECFIVEVPLLGAEQVITKNTLTQLNVQKNTL